MLLVGKKHDRCDVVLHLKNRTGMRISEKCSFYDALQFLIQFCCGYDDYHINIAQIKSSIRASYNDPYTFHVMVKSEDSNPIIHYRDLFSQFIVDT